MALIADAAVCRVDGEWQFVDDLAVKGAVASRSSFDATVGWCSQAYSSASGGGGVVISQSQSQDPTAFQPPRMPHSTIPEPSRVVRGVRRGHDELDIHVLEHERAARGHHGRVLWLARAARLGGVR